MIAEILFGRRERAAIVQQLGHPRAGMEWLGGSNTLAGVPVDENTAMNYAACWAATRWITASISHLPFNLYREKPGGGKEIAWSHPVQRLIYAQPNRGQSAMMFRASMLQQQINAGNCYAEIERTNGGQVVALHPVHFSRVTVKDGDDGYVYEVRNRKGGASTVDEADMFHVPSLISDDGIIGKGVVRAARESIGFGIGTERHGAAYFGNGARPSVLLEHPGKLSDTARTNLRSEWVETHGGPDKSGKPAVLQEGMKASILSISPEDSQFLQTRQHNVEEIARWYGVPPHKIQHLLRATFSNIEHSAIEAVTDSLIPYAKLWEQEVWRKLLTPREQEQYYAKHLFDALLRGDTLSRTEALSKQFQNGALTVNQWMEIEDRNPVGPDGDVHFVPLNMTTLERAVAGEPDPVTTIDTSKQTTPVVDQEDTTEDSTVGDATEDDSTARAAVLDVFNEVVSRMVAMEADAAERAAKQPSSFLDKVEAFYGDHEERMFKALQKPLACVQAVCGLCRLLEEIVAKHCAESKLAILKAAEVPASELAASVAKCVANWSERNIEPLSEVVE